jgi:uncharacterized protein YndB with AHSA1/START domain
VNRTVVHDTFVLERKYPAAPSRVFGAFADLETKKHWWGPDEFQQNGAHDLDFRIGGRETMSGALPGSASETFTFDAIYQDIVDGERIVYTYEMTMNGRRISVSVATLEFLPDGNGTHFVITEQGAYLDGLDTCAQRAEGTDELLNALGTYLEKGK